MQAAYAQKNGYEALDRGTRAGAGSGSGSKGTLGPQRSGPPPRGAAPEARPLLMAWAACRCDCCWLLQVTLVLHCNVCFLLTTFLVSKSTGLLDTQRRWHWAVSFFYLHLRMCLLIRESERRTLT